MLRNKAYYAVKPWLPAWMRISLRRLHARRIIHSCAGDWPISDSAGTKPADWPGWPDGKRFALVLTHDVEEQLGLERCRKLMRLEMDLGFRSSFNFIPEGGYDVSQSMRDELVGAGFEVGVHDLYHDGKLYHSKRGFIEKAKRINRYLKEWDAVGFRAGFMLHDLDWLRELEVLYDASTFDTDPFEPKPVGVNTIFPFWVSAHEAAGGNGNRGESQGCAPGLRSVHQQDLKGYVELPYTLPQDFTLFVLLQERNPVIWMRKLDWIARRGGMALVNVHPDYLHYGVAGSVLDHYTDFLLYVANRYHGEFWHVLPREVATYVRRWKAAEQCSIATS